MQALSYIWQGSFYNNVVEEILGIHLRAAYLRFHIGPVQGGRFSMTTKCQHGQTQKFEHINPNRTQNMLPRGRPSVEIQKFMKYSVLVWKCDSKSFHLRSVLFGLFLFQTQGLLNYNNTNILCRWLRSRSIQALSDQRWAGVSAMCRCVLAFVRFVFGILVQDHLCRIESRPSCRRGGTKLEFIRALSTLVLYSLWLWLCKAPLLVILALGESRPSASNDYFQLMLSSIDLTCKYLGLNVLSKVMEDCRNVYFYNGCVRARAQTFDLCTDAKG